MGLDSLMAIELRNQITQTLAVTVPLSSFFDEASITSLTATVGDALGDVVEGKGQDGTLGTKTPPSEVSTPKISKREPAPIANVQSGTKYEIFEDEL